MAKATSKAEIKEFLNQTWREACAAHLEGRFADAAAAYQKVLELAPKTRAVAAKAALMAWHFKDTDRARRLLAWYLEAYPEDEDQWYNAGKFEQDTGNTAAAIAYYQAAITLRLRRGEEPKVEALCNLALCYAELDQDDAAEALFEEALKVDAQSAESRFNRSFVKMARGDASGWQDYEARMDCASFQWSHERVDLTGPRWKGEPLWPGATLLLHTEQGFGDVIQFARFVPRVQAMVPEARIVLEVPGELLRLFRSAWPSIDIMQRGLPVGDYDATASLLSLPALTGLTFEDVPPPVPFGEVSTHVDLDGLLGEAGDRPRVGIVWAGSKMHPNDKRRSLPVEQLRALLESVPGICWFSLQVGEREAELTDTAFALAEGSTFVKAGTAFRDFGDSAQLLRRLDCVVTIDSAIGHLAGSLDVPTLILLQTPSEWRWMRNRTDSPWYTSVRLIRQPRGGDWPSVLDAVASILHRSQENIAA